MSNSASNIFGLARGLITLPVPRYTGAGDVRVSMGGSGDAPPSKDPSEGSSSPPPQYSASPVPSAPSVTNSPMTTVYKGVSAAVQFDAPSAAVAPAYGTPVAPNTIPSGAAPPPPTSYPVTDLIDLPSSAGISMVVKPVINIGARPSLAAPTLAGFDPEEIPIFDEDLPGFDVPDMVSLAAPLPIDYTLDADLIARMKRTLEGDDGFDAAVQALMHEKAVEGIDRAELFGVRAVLADVAARGFSMPVGSANGRAADLLHETREKRMAAAFAVRDETYEKARKLLLDTTSEAMALDAKHAELQKSYATKLVKTLKFNVLAVRDLFNATVQMINEKAGLVKSISRAYREYASAVEAQDGAVVSQVKAEMAKIATYRADVDMFIAQAGTAETIAKIESTDIRQQALKLAEYEAYLTGVAANVTIVQQNMESFREAVRALAKSVSYEGDQLEAYSSYVSAIGSMSSVNEANVSAYSAFWRAEGARTGAYSSYVQDATQVFNAQASDFKDYASAHRSYISALIAKVSAQASIAATYARGMRGATGYTSAYNRAAAEHAAARNMTALSNASSDMNEGALRTQLDAEQARLEAGAVAASATISAGLAQAALGVVDASVRISGSVDTGESGAERNNTSVTFDGSRSWRRTTTTGKGDG